MSEPLISVIIPTCKRAEKIERAIVSVLNQDYGNIEIIVVDDNEPGSFFSDETRKVIENIPSSKKITVLGTSGKIGGGAARNFGCKYANGEYLAFLDDDDEYKAEKLSKQLEFMLSNDLEMSYQDVEWYSESGKLIERRVLNHAVGYSRQELLRAHLITPISPTAIYMLKKSLYDRTDGFGEVKTGQDWFLMLRCIEADGNISYMPGAFVKQYLHSSERLSTGQNKIDGENLRHQVVKTYYPQLSKKDIRYIEFRHNAVLAFASKRSNRLFDACKYAARAVLISPMDCASEGKKYLLSKGKDDVCK